MSRLTTTAARSPRSGRAGGVIFVVVGVVLGLAVSCSGFREDEIECEQAVVRLRDCCPGFDTRKVDCSYSDQLDCSDNVTGRTYPALSIDDSQCVQRKSCADLIADEACTRGQAAKPRKTSTGLGDGGSTSSGSATSSSSSSSPPPSSKVCGK